MAEFTDDYFLNLTMKYDERIDDIYCRWALWCAKSNDKYYVYLGITKNLKVAEKLKQFYENQGYQVYIKEVELKNEEFYNNVTQFDLLLNNDISESEMLTIEEVVLANYEEITRKES